MARGRDKNHKSSRGRGSRGRGGRGRGSSTRGPQPQLQPQREDRGAFAKRSLVQHRPHDEVEAPVGTASWAVYDGGRATAGSRDEYDAPPQSTSAIDFFALAARLASLDDATLLMVDTKRAEVLLGKALVRPRGEKVVAVEEEKEVSRPETTVGGGAPHDCSHAVLLRWYEHHQHQHYQHQTHLCLHLHLLCRCRLHRRR